MLLLRWKNDGRKAAGSRLLSKLPNNIAQSNAKCFGDFQEGINSDCPIGALDLTDVNRMQIRLLRQFLLAHARFLTVGANIVTDQFTVFGTNCHSSLAKQEAANLIHKLVG